MNNTLAEGLEKIDKASAAAVAATSAWNQTRTILRIVVVILLVAGVLWILYALESVILLVVLSIFFAYLISPLVEVVHRPIKIGGAARRIPRSIAIGIVYVLIVVAVTIALSIILPRIGRQVTSFFEQAPDYINSARARSQGMTGVYDRFDLPPGARLVLNQQVTNAITGASKYTGEAGLTWIRDHLLLFGSYFPWLFLIPILAFFFLKDVESFRRSALQMLPRGRWRWRGDEFFQDVNSTLAAYIRAQLSACAIVGLICTIGFVILGLPYWLALGVFAGMLEFIPLAGPLVVGIVAVFLAGFHSFGSALIVLIFLLVLRVAEDYVIYPRLIGQGIHLHPLAVILAILSGAELAGVAGIFLAIPVIAIATVSYRHWLEHRGSEGLVADILRPETTTLAVAQLAEAASDLAQAIEEETPDGMARRRPDLTTGELRMPQSE